MLTDSSSLVTRLTEECHRSDGERSLEWQTPVVAYPFGSLHDLCVAVVVVLLDEVVHHFRQDLSILLIICQFGPSVHMLFYNGVCFLFLQQYDNFLLISHMFSFSHAYAIPYVILILQSLVLSVIQI